MNFVSTYSRDILFSMKLCSERDCRNKHYAKSLCSKHWQRMYHHGDPNFTLQETHGLENSPEYKVWSAMKRRCYYPKDVRFSRYKGRGIKVCDQWRNSFSTFYKDMGPRPEGRYTLERINNDGNYEPSNCRWATYLEQANNRHTNINININGTTKTLKEWCVVYGLKYPRTYYRIKHGWDTEKALDIKNGN